MTRNVAKWIKHMTRKEIMDEAVSRSMTRYAMRVVLMRADSWNPAVAYAPFANMPRRLEAVCSEFCRLQEVALGRRAASDLHQKLNFLGTPHAHP